MWLYSAQKVIEGALLAAKVGSWRSSGLAFEDEVHVLVFTVVISVANGVVQVQVRQTSGGLRRVHHESEYSGGERVFRRTSMRPNHW